MEALTEHRHSRSPKKTPAAIEALLEKQRAVAVCTHRPALPTVFGQLAKHMPRPVRALLPDAEPYLSPGELVVCHVAHRRRRGASWQWSSSSPLTTRQPTWFAVLLLLATAGVGAPVPGMRILFPCTGRRR